MTIPPPPSGLPFNAQPQDRRRLKHIRKQMRRARRRQRRARSTSSSRSSRSRSDSSGSSRSSSSSTSSTTDSEESYDEFGRVSRWGGVLFFVVWEVFLHLFESKWLYEYIIRSRINIISKICLTLIGINVICEVPFYFVCVCQKCYIISV